ncbi:MAG: PEP-CTERM sorting domain-containing protein [Nitrospirota bacterium]
MIKKRVCLMFVLVMLSAAGAAFATPLSYLEVSQMTYSEYVTSGSIGLPPSPGDPTLIYSSNTKTSVGTHDGHNEAQYSMVRRYQSETGSVSYNDYPSMSGGLPVGISIGAGHSAAFGSGYASAADRVLRGSTNVISNGAGFSESWSQSEIRNRFTVLPGNSGLNEGDTARIRLDVRLDGSMRATGRSWPGSGNAFPHMMAGLSIKDPLVRIDTGEGWYTPRSVSFGADADIEAGRVYKPYWGYSFSSYAEYSWGASTNTGIDLSGSDTSYVQSYDEDTSVSHHLGFDTGLLRLEFDAIVGHTLDFYAYLDVFSFADGLGTALSDFSTTFGPALIDPNDTGTLIVWELDGQPTNPAVPEPSSFLLLGAGIAGLALLRKRRKS